MKTTIVMFFCCLSFAINGAMIGLAHSEGVIKSFDETTVTLVDEEGDTFTVDRKLVNTKKYKVRQGERVMIYVDPLPPKAPNKKKVI